MTNLNTKMNQSDTHKGADPNYFQPNIVDFNDRDDEQDRKAFEENPCDSTYQNPGLNVNSANIVFPTELHRACASHTSTVAQLRAHLLARPNAAAVRDSNGRLPLHSIAYRLLSISIAEPPHMVAPNFKSALTEEMEEFVIELYRAYPHAIITCETSRNAGGVRGRGGASTTIGTHHSAAGPRGYLHRNNLDDPKDTPAKIPFSDILNRWVETCHTQNGFFASKSRINSGSEAFESSTFIFGQDDETLKDDITIDSRSTLTMPTVFRSVASVSLASPKSRGLHTGDSTPTLNGVATSSNPYSSGASLAGRSVKSKRRATKNGDSGSRRSGENESLNNFDPEKATNNRFGQDRNANNIGSAEFLPYDGDVQALCQFEDLFPTSGMVFVPPIVEFSLRVLSRIFLEIQQTCQLLRFSKQNTVPLFDSDKRNENKAESQVFDEEETLCHIGYLLVDSLASVPSLVKTIVLIHDRDPAKKRIFSLPLVQHVLRFPSAVGDWIVYMLECVDESVMSKAVDYLELLSEHAHDQEYDFLSRGGVILNNVTQRHHMYHKVAMLDYFLHATLALDDPNEVERAAATEIVQKAVEMHLDQPWQITMALVDGLVHVVTMIAFSICGNMLINNDAYTRAAYVPITFLLLTGEIYFLLRIPCECRALYKISPATFYSSALSLRTPVDILATGLALGSTVALDQILQDGTVNGGVNNTFRITLAITSGLLWLKFLLFLKKVNTGVAQVMFVINKVRKKSGNFLILIKCLILFPLTHSLQVATDLRGLIALFLIASLAFGQMFFFVIGNSGTCFRDNSRGQFDASCAPLRSYYIHAMTMSFGSEEVQDHNSGFFGFLLVLFTISVVIVLFNAFVAVAIDSHARWTEQSFSKGGLERLAYAADLIAIQNLLGGEWTLMQFCSATLFSSSLVVLFIVSIDSIRKAMDMRYGNSSIIWIVVGLLVLLLISVVTFLAHINFQTVPRRIDARPSFISKLLNYKTVRWLATPVKVCVRKMLSLDDERRPESDEPEWKGRWAKMRSDTERVVYMGNTNMKDEVCHMMRSMEVHKNRIEESQRLNVLAQMRASEARIQSKIEEFHKILVSKLAC